MAPAWILICTFYVMLVTANLAEGIGVNWGRQASHHLLSSSVVSMLMENKIDKVKLSDANPRVVAAFAKTGIELMIAIPNEELARFQNSYDNATNWVKENVTKHINNEDVNMKYVAVGNKPFPKTISLKTAFAALQNIQKALNQAGLRDKIKATIPFNADISVSVTEKPSGGVFSSDITDLIGQILRFLDSNSAPFVVNICPFLTLRENPIHFSFFGGDEVLVLDKAVNYTNVFDVKYDTLVSALSNAGFPKMKIIVGEIGWPTDGDINANVTNAMRFYDGFLRKMSRNEGTPLRPGPLEVYLNSLIDEDMKSVRPGNFERHWGIFRYDGKAKFPIDLSLEGNKTWPAAARGVVYQPSQWCVLNKDNTKKDKAAVEKMFNQSCFGSDCSSLGFGSSCGRLDYDGNVSYALNMFFQKNDQFPAVCELGGLGMVVKENPSQGDCLFPVQIINAEEKLDTMSVATVGVALLLVLYTLF